MRHIRLLMNDCCKILLALFSLVCAGSGEVATFRGDVQHTGIYGTTTAPDLKTVKWMFKSQGRIFSSPAISAGLVFFGSADHNLYAIDAKTGTQRWKYETGGEVNSSPAIANGLVYFGSLDGNFYAVETSTGKLKWRFATAGERRFTASGIHGMTPSTELMPDPWDFFLSSPAVYQGMVYFGSGDHNVYALDAKDGRLRWKFTTGDVVHSSPALADGLLYIGSWDRWLYALDAWTGKLVWKFQTGDDPKVHNQMGIQGSPAVADGTVYFGCRDANVYAVDAKTGRERWRFNNKGSWVIASPAIYDHKVYFPTSDSFQFVALDGASGRELFRTNTNTYGFSSAAIAGGTAYFGTFDGKLHGIDLTRGQTKFEFQTSASKSNASKYLAANGGLNAEAIFSRDYTLAETIFGIYKIFSLGSILSSPAIAGGVLYAGSTDGYLYALN
jgi:eukaryotic-like serine/threonine-protein kinase